MSELRAYIKNLPHDFEKSDLLWELRRLNVNHTGRLYLMKSAVKSSQYAQCHSMHSAVHLVGALPMKVWQSLWERWMGSLCLHQSGIGG